MRLLRSLLLPFGASLSFVALLLLHASHNRVSSFTSPFTSTSRPRRNHLTRIARPSTAATVEESTGCSVGDTRGATLLLSNLHISTGSGDQILRDINFRVESRERWGIVGANGCGKSTLLGAITGAVRIDQGKALVASKVKVGYLKQTAVSGSRKTVRDEAASEMQEINNEKERMAMLEKLVADGDASDDTLNKLARSQARFEDIGGFTQEQDVDVVLKGLGFQPPDSNRLVSDFSGGWQMRIALARLLLSKPDLLLLDEPSNHLDSSARDWLATYLSKYEGSIILVSHDVALLSKGTSSIAEVSGKTLVKYVSCTYEKYLQEKEFRAKSAIAEYERNLKEAERLQDFVDKFGASATKASQAQSRVKAIERMRKEGKLDPPPLAVTAKRRKPSLALPDPPKGIGADLLSLKNADIGYDDAILKNINLTINRGIKLIIRGPNGAGKSTLLAALRGNLPLLAGERIENDQLRQGVFTQDLAQELDVSARAIDLVTEYARTGVNGDITISDEVARGAMGRLGLGDEKPMRKVGELSGGEKARVALSMFALKPSNLLLLDEPSNHLDVEMIEALGEALNSWGGKDGSVVVVSHDRNFCEQVGFTHVASVDGGSLLIEERGLTDGDWQMYDISGTSESLQPQKTEMSAEEKAELDRKRKVAFNAPKRISKLEVLIEQAEERIQEYDEEMMRIGSDVEKLLELTDRKTKEEDNVSTLMEEWEYLETLIAEMA
mmetsp:Transcript_15888/g.36628  ORF Transcript_15888/g.36628 Transcript_15888/m.36628 type:complete len:726 (-) Transcript_15888:548-2725(-)